MKLIHSYASKFIINGNLILILSFLKNELIFFFAYPQLNTMNTNGVKYVYIGHNKSLMEMSCVEVIEERKKKWVFFNFGSQLRTYLKSSF